MSLLSGFNRRGSSSLPPPSSARILLSFKRSATTAAFRGGPASVVYGHADHLLEYAPSRQNVVQRTIKKSRRGTRESAMGTQMHEAVDLSYFATYTASTVGCCAT
jgi:hypothetical protein